MTCAISVKDKLEEELVDEDFAGCVNALNMATAQGKSFAIMDDPEGGHIAFNIPNILTIKEID